MKRKDDKQRVIMFTVRFEGLNTRRVDTQNLITRPLTMSRYRIATTIHQPLIQERCLQWVLMSLETHIHTWSLHDHMNAQVHSVYLPIFTHAILQIPR